MSCESGSLSLFHSEHSCGHRSDVWSMLASLVTEGLQAPASSIIASRGEQSILQVGVSSVRSS